MKNMSKVDRIVRLVIGLGLIVLLFALDSGWRYVGLLGFVLVITSLIGVCPLYLLFKINTQKKDQ